MKEFGKEQFLEILKKHEEGVSSVDEEEFLKAYFNIFELNADYTDGLNDEQQDRLNHHLKNKIDQAIGHSLPVRKLNFRRTVAIAASIFIILSVGLYFYFNGDMGVWGSSQYFAKHDIAPGNNKAILTLANGEKITLSNAKTGVVINTSQLTYNDGTKIIDKVQSGPISGPVTITTPKGCQYEVNLPDGTYVWLNAGSSLKFPSSFSSFKERRVELSGEGYFAVKHNIKQPFRVESKGQIVEDIGTEFNINAYTDESVIKTTLIEGSARIVVLNPAIALSLSHVTLSLSKGVLRQAQHDIGQAQHDMEHAQHNMGQAQRDNSVVLKPNQQSTLTHAGTLKVTQVDPDEVIAWKEGWFYFKSASLQNVLSEVSRWYDLDIIYEGKIPTDRFTGKISRTANLSTVLKMFKLSDIRFRIDGRKMTVNQSNN